MATEIPHDPRESIILARASTLIDQATITPDNVANISVDFGEERTQIRASIVLEITREQGYAIVGMYPVVETEAVE